MPTIIPCQLTNRQEHTEEVDEIIAAPPSWILRWGITIFFALLCLLASLSIFITYPDIIKTRLKIRSNNTPKAAVTKIPGQLVRLLVRDKEKVSEGQPLAYIESIADHDQVLRLLTDLKNLQKHLINPQSGSQPSFNAPLQLQLGELQQFYQNFYLSYMACKSTIKNGFNTKKKRLLEQELNSIIDQRKQLLVQQVLQEKNFRLAEEEYERHERFLGPKPQASTDLKKAERELLAQEYAMRQTKLSLNNNNSNYSTKQREILELNNKIEEQKLSFAQVLSTLISKIEDWKSNHVLSAMQKGIVAFNGTIQEKQFLDANQKVLYVIPENTYFFGDMPIQQYNLGKIKKGQKVLIKLESYSYEEYGIIWGEIENISDVPFSDNSYFSKVAIRGRDELYYKKGIKLKDGLMADAEIITKEASFLDRLLKNINRVRH